MSLSVGIGFSQNLNVQEAAKEAAFQSKTQLRQDRIDLCIIFSTIHYPPEETLPVMEKILPNAKLIGCSTAGIIQNTGIYKRGITALTLHSNECKFGISAIQQINDFDAHHIGQTLAQQAIQDLGPSPRQAFLFFMDDKMHSTSELLKGMQEMFGNVFSIIGAGSSDDFHFQNTFQMLNQQSLKDSMIGLLLGGLVSVGVGARHGWRPLGKPRFITEVDGHIIREIDNQAAFHIYKEYFGDEAYAIGQNRLGHMSILYPLGVHIPGSHEYLLRNAIETQPDGSIVCQGDLPVGSEVHLMLGNKESCKIAAGEAALEAKEGLLGKAPKLILVLESLSRLKLLGRDAHAEIQAVRNVFGLDVPIVGMYSNGEVSPFQTVERFKKSHHLNESIVVMAIA